MGGGSSVGIKKPIIGSDVKSGPVVIIAGGSMRASEINPAGQKIPSDSDDIISTPSSYRQKDFQNERRFEEEIADEVDVEADGSPRSEASAGVTELFSHTAMSLDMNNDDLLFNLLYFGDGNNSNFGAVLNNAQQETIALHSENNTPYKLKPASESTIAGMTVEYFCPGETDTHELECAVCKDDIEIESEILRIPACKHYFHKDCLVRWIKLQGWCPVCRAKIDTPPDDASAAKTSKMKSPLASAAEEHDEDTDEDVGNPLLSRHFCDESDRSRDSTCNVPRKDRHQEQKDQDQHDLNDGDTHHCSVSRRLLVDDEVSNDLVH